MSTTVRLNAINVVATDSRYPLTRIPWASIPDEVESGSYKYDFYIKYDSVPSQYLNKVVEETKIYIKEKNALYYDPVTQGTYAASAQAPYIYPIEEVWDESTISYNNEPAMSYWSSFSLSHNPDYYAWSYIYGISNRYDSSFDDHKKYRLQLLNTITYGGRLSVPQAYVPGFHDGEYITQNTKVKVKTSENLPYIEITFGSATTSLSIASCSPTSGFRGKYSANTFIWSTSVNGFSINDPTIVHAYFRYRANSSSQYTEIDCGSALSYTMPANTISTDSFQWQVSIVDSNGHTSTSDWYTISTVEALSTATIVYPKNVTIDGSVINRFEWLHNISTGTSETKADLQYSSDNGTTWVQFATPTGSATYYDVPANTFIAGTYLWKVRTYNTDNAAGSWADAKPFTVIAKPTVSAVTSEQNPKPKITWQSAGQQAYRVYINDVFDSGVLFGTNDYYNLPIYLDDGTYTVSVVVQNRYGLWSNPGTAPINVTNTPGTAMTLVPTYEEDGLKLTWTSVLTYAYYVVYRDNVPIAKIRTNEFKDYTALGQHTYFIRGIYASSKFYGLSNVLEADTSIGHLMITDLESEISLSIEQNDSSYAELIITDSINNTSVYISAADYPINEISHFKSKSIRFDCAFIKNNASALSFRTMLGKLVCVKTPSGTSVVGNLLAQNRSENYFYEKYSCTLVQTHYEEGIQL